VDIHSSMLPVLVRLYRVPQAEPRGSSLVLGHTKAEPGIPQRSLLHGLFNPEENPWDAELLLAFEASLPSVTSVELGGN
jgi:hypothetical protein